ncbi:MAG: hypothetical protein IKH77_04185 [Clostridia bacterium]|nr:hypothetical protein [Clostridia bacterium]
MWRELNPRGIHIQTCHMDPDIRKEVRKDPPIGWKAAFGQRNSAEGHLENKRIDVGDVFLFFGLFRKTRYIGRRLSFVPSENSMHAIWGWLQIGEIVRGTVVRQFPWHPHSDDKHIFNEHHNLSNNTIYVASDRLILDGCSTGLPGAGTFAYSDKRVLTVPGAKQVTRWHLNGVFGKVPLSYHCDPDRVKDGYFQSVAKGQEFVFDEDQRVTRWVWDLLR